MTKFSWFSNESASGVIDAPALSLAGISFEGPIGRYLFALTIVAVLTFLAYRLVSSQTGRNFIAVRDNETAARIIGIPVLRTKLLAFAISSFIVGVAGVIWAFAYLRTVEPAGFNLDRSFQILFIVIIGGLASIRGAFFGAALIVVFPLVLSRLGSLLLGDVFNSGVLDMTQRIVLGALIILFLITEPDGLVSLWDRLKLRITAAVRRAWNPSKPALTGKGFQQEKAYQQLIPETNTDGRAPADRRSVSRYDLLHENQSSSLCCRHQPRRHRLPGHGR